MIKSFTIAIYLIFSIFCSTENRSDYHFQTRDTSNPKINTNDIKEDLSTLEEKYDNLDYNSVMEKYSSQIPSGFTAIKFRNFVIYSNLPEKTTYDVIDKDIRLTIAAMVDNYIKIKPSAVTPIFIFEDMETYKNFSVKYFDIIESDLSPYGFYKISKNAIVIKYVSWKGSPSHEVTHTMIQSDFPEIPSWFNEGLAALNEKSTYKNGELVGDFSWRIISIRKAWDNDTYTGIEHLMQTGDEELYGKRSSFYYAQSRYLLMMLQQKGLLVKYYKYFRDNFEQDKTGIAQLEFVTGKNLDVIDAELLSFIKSFKQ